MAHQPLKTIEWTGGAARIVDQTLLPTDLKYFDLHTAEDVWEAIKRLRVRGAPAIGIAAAFGLHLGTRHFSGGLVDEFMLEVTRVAAYLATSRPTAVNLFWALDRAKRLAQQRAAGGANVAELKATLLSEARRMIDEDNAVCRAIGQHAQVLLKDGDTWLTHCNAGGLATAQWGTALAPIYIAAELGKRIHVFADETRPLLQGARITAFELQRAGIATTLITDNMAAMVMSQGRVQAVCVGTDRVAANGDFANKIGTLGVAILAREFRIPLYVAAPISSIDLACDHGGLIPIEERAPEEVTHGFGRQTGPAGVAVFNPAFDVTPAKYVTAFITEQGLLYPDFAQSLQKTRAH